MSKPEVIGEGTYGCVHKPALNCNKKKSEPGKVSKVMRKRDADDELKEYLLIREIDTDGKYHLGTPTKCSIDDNIQNIESINKCRKITTNKSELRKLKLLIMEHGGYNIEDYVNLFSNKNPSDETMHTLETFLASFANIFKGLELFDSKKVAHHDLKPQNIVYNPDTNNTKFIDFGLMTNYSTVLSETSRSKYHFAENCHWSFPFEITLWNNKAFKSFISEKKRAEYVKNDVDRHIKVKCGTFFHYLFGDVKREERSRLWKIWYADYIGFLMSLTKNDYDKVLNKSLSTIDTYGVGLALLDICRKLSFHIEIISNELNMIYSHKYNLLQKLEELAYNMIHPNVFLRHSPIEASETYKKILNDSGLIDDIKTNKELTMSRTLSDNLSSIGLSSKKLSSISKKSSSIEFFTPKETLTLEDTRSPSMKECGENKEYNRITKRCVNKCKPGYVRNADFKCVTNQEGPCPEGKERNPKTRRCVKKCKPGYKRNATFKCVKDKKN